MDGFNKSVLSSSKQKPTREQKKIQEIVEFISRNKGFLFYFLFKFADPQKYCRLVLFCERILKMLENT